MFLQGPVLGADCGPRGSFTGKGITRSKQFSEVLEPPVPVANTILSHDRSKGAYARAGLPPTWKWSTIIHRNDRLQPEEASLGSRRLQINWAATAGVPYFFGKKENGGRNPFVIHLALEDLDNLRLASLSGNGDVA